MFLDSKQFAKAIIDDNESLDLMKSDGEKSDGTANYPEYPDTFVERALAKEGLADWNGYLIQVVLIPYQRCIFLLAFLSCMISPLFHQSCRRLR